MKKENWFCDPTKSYFLPFKSTKKIIFFSFIFLILLWVHRLKYAYTTYPLWKKNLQPFSNFTHFLYFFFELYISLYIFISSAWILDNLLENRTSGVIYFNWTFGSQQDEKLKTKSVQKTFFYRFCFGSTFLVVNVDFLLLFFWGVYYIHWIELYKKNIIPDFQQTAVGLICYVEMGKYLAVNGI